MGPGLWEELRGMLLFSSLSHALFLGLLGLVLYHNNWPSLERDSEKYPVYSVNLVNFLESSLTNQPKLLSNLSGLNEERRVIDATSFLKPIFKPTGFRKAKDLAVISEEPVRPPDISKRVAYPTLQKPAKGGKPRKDVISDYLLYPPDPTKTIARRPMTGLNTGKEQPITPILSSSASLTPRTRIESLGKATLAPGKGHMEIPESLQGKSFQTRSMSKGRIQELASLLEAEALSPAQISHPAIPLDPALTSFSQGRGGIDPSLIKGGFTSLNTHDPKLGPYITRVKDRVLSFWRYPMEAEPGLKGEVKLAFTVERDGSVSRIELLKSSGYPLLDNGAIQALSRASPFSPLPQEIKINNLSVAGAFKYNME